MVTTSYFGHIRPQDHAFRLDTQLNASCTLLSFGESFSRVDIYLNDEQLAEVVSLANEALATRLAAKGVNYLNRAEDPVTTEHKSGSVDLLREKIEGA